MRQPFDGKGKLTWNDSEYDGEFVEGKKHGQGTFTYPDGSKYVGDWQHDFKEGKGIMLSLDAEYDGSWSGNRRHGRGKQISFIHPAECRKKYPHLHPDECRKVYEGDWVDGKRHGFGTFSFDGSKYEGEWQKDEYHGEGKLNMGCKLPCPGNPRRRLPSLGSM